MRIGITHSKDFHPTNYINSVQRIGGGPVLINEKVHLVTKDDLDAIIFSGGGDIESKHFSKEPHPMSGAPDKLRDELELELAGYAIARGMPILGICRGIQLVNCALGGTLIQHLPDFQLHQGTTVDLWHDIKTIEGSILERLFGENANVNSWHHQAVDVIGKGLTATAFAGNVTEALEGENMLLVQFHPERMGEVGYPVFDWLKKAVKE